MHHGAAGTGPGPGAPTDDAREDGQGEPRRGRAGAGADTGMGRKDEACEPELDRLAEAWITLWQNELAALAADAEVAAAWRQAFGLATAWLGAAPDRAGGRAGHERAAAAPRPTAAGAASGAGAGDALGGADAAALLRRIDALERRLAALEGAPAGGEADRRRPRRRRPPA